MENTNTNQSSENTTNLGNIGSLDISWEKDEKLDEQANTLSTSQTTLDESNEKKSKGFFGKLFSSSKNKNTLNSENKAVIEENTEENINNTPVSENSSETIKTNNEEKNEKIWISRDQFKDNQVVENTNTSVFEETKFLDDPSTKKWFFSRLFWSKKKEIDTQNIKDFEWAIKWIKFFIDTQDWLKAKLWVEEIKTKEKDAYLSLLDKIKIEDIRKKQTAIYNKKFNTIEKLNDELLNKERIYTEKKEIEKFRIKFIQIKEKLNELIWTNNNYEALDLINSFFDENKDSPIVLKFYDKWKKIIQKRIEKKIKSDEKKVKNNTKAEALALIWERTNLLDTKNSEEKNENRKNYFFKNIINKLNIYKKIQSKLREKKLIDEVTMLIESENEINEATKKKRLENMHIWLIKEIDNENLLWYDFYAKILWKDKISGDTFWFSEDDFGYKFFLWDATWHWIQAWLIITLLTRLFNTFSKNNLLEKVVFEINNWLKQDLKSKNFITWIFCEIDKKFLSSIRYIWMGHEPILIYRKKTWEVEKLVAWWLAAWIRIMNDLTQIKSRDLSLEDWDIVIIYSDWIVEARDINNELLGVNWLSTIIKKLCNNNSNYKVSLLYNDIIEEVKKYKWWNTNFDDDASILMLKRNSNRDIIDKRSQYLKDLTVQEGLTKKNIKELEWKTKEEIKKELVKIKKEKQLKLILDNLEKLFITWEILKLKQESIRYIKEWFIHPKINSYLKKAIANERKYKVDLKEQKMKTKYKVLNELLKKWDYNTVIKECNEIISNDWNITI